MIRRMWFFVIIDALLISVIITYASQAFAADTLQSVIGAGGFDWWPLLILAVTAVLIAGMIIWHKRNPSGQTKALMDAHAAMSTAADKAHEALLWSQQHVADLLAKDKPAEQTIQITAVTGQPDQDKLAEVERTRVAYENAKADAGIP